MGIKNYIQHYFKNNYFNHQANIFAVSVFSLSGSGKI